MAALATEASTWQRWKNSLPRWLKVPSGIGATARHPPLCLSRLTVYVSSFVGAPHSRAVCVPTRAQ